jgi:hypothetical protein
MISCLDYWGKYLIGICNYLWRETGQPSGLREGDDEEGEALRVFEPVY